MSGKRAFLELLKQEGVDIIFGNPGTTELPLMDALAVDNELRYVLGLQEAAVIGMADGYAQALRRTEGGQPDSGHRRPARHGLQRQRADPVGRLAADRAAAGEMVRRGASPRRSAAAPASRREDRARSP